ncbi:hypothetical protein D9615_000746 [Tricholomella constricta]|uniref:VWFA domain-containing protein n=1 Tax=Tricholomella constricta TaxID=117010 RepID=A0A8H5MC23_9AGAR|nr:hypothetical protein D9615_000746 [Tricholomella constricta]
MPPLPALDDPQAQRIVNEASDVKAYLICLEYEKEFTAIAGKLRCVRILGFLLLNAPNQDVRMEVTKCILSCKDESDLVNLGSFFERYVILPFKKFKGRTPSSSAHPSRPSFEAVKRQVKVDIREVPKNHKAAKDRALIRDNWRCVATGLIDSNVPEDPPPEFAIYTECAHIIPEATFFGLDYSASILAVLSRFRYDISSFNGEKVHSLTNVMTMERNMHDAFDRLKFYLEATSQKDRYEAKFFGPKPLRDARQFVTFTTKDPEYLPVPAPELLALHAMCCKVAHLSGAAEWIDMVYADEIGVLAPDGTSGDMLGYALSSLSNHTRPMRKETEEDALETLIKFNTVLVVDDSSSMRGSRWAEARQALSGLARKAGLYDTDGIDIYFLNSSKVGLNLKNPQAVEDLFDRVEPRGATPIAGKLEELLQDYVSQIEAVQRDKEKLKQIKPINYIVLTDGAATDDPESIIVHYARRLDRGNFPPSQLGIQFVQIGNSKSATMYLKELDDELAGTHKIRDIVDTTPFTDIGGELNPDILIKILLGGINRRIDKVGARRVH